jgi:hypothetical protein
MPGRRELWRMRICRMFGRRRGHQVTIFEMMPELPVTEQRINSFVEADLVISEEDAKRESGRCLSCCRLCYNKDQDTA